MKHFRELTPCEILDVQLHWKIGVVPVTLAKDKVWCALRVENKGLDDREIVFSENKGFIVAGLAFPFVDVPFISYESPGEFIIGVLNKDEYQRTYILQYLENELEYMDFYSDINNEYSNTVLFGLRERRAFVSSCINGIQKGLK